MNLRDLLIFFCFLIPAAVAQDFPIRCHEGMCILPEAALEAIAGRMESLFRENQTLRGKTGCL